MCRPNWRLFGNVFLVHDTFTVAYPYGGRPLNKEITPIRLSLCSTLRSLFKDKNVSLCVFTGKQFENTEMFGQYPLQVNGFKDLHECLEAAMIEGEIESLHSAENSAKSGQEVCREVVSFFSIPEHHNMLKHLKLFLFLRYSFCLRSNQSLRWRKRKHMTSDRDVT